MLKVEDIKDRLMKKKIILLGVSESGKTNYVASALAYMGKYGCMGWRLQEGNTKVDERIDELQEHFQSGKWLEKTDKNKEGDEYRFYLPSNFLRFEFLPKEVVIKDWPGEAFSAIASGNDGGNIKLEEFRKDCNDAAGFMLFIDGEWLGDKTKEKEVKKCLRIMKEEIITKGSLKRTFAVVVTKSDYLFPEYQTIGEDYQMLSKHLDRMNEKRAEIREKLGTLFNLAEARGYDIDIFFVTLVPDKKYFKVSEKAGRIPSEDWSLKEVMETHYGHGPDVEEGFMYGPFLWILDHV